MTDYDGVRTCCTSAEICKRCWAFIANAVRVLDAALRTQFGYHHLLWVYSGRRGIHLWISDDEAMGLTDELRRAVVGALTVIEGGKEMAKKVNVRGPGTKGQPGELPPSLWHARDEGSRMWYRLLDDQECFLSEDGWRTLLKLVPDKKIVDTLEQRWEKQPGVKSSKKWDELKAEVKDTGVRASLLLLLPLLMSHRPEILPLWKTLSYNIRIRVSTLKYPSTETIFLKHRSAYILKLAEFACPWTLTVWTISIPMQFPQSSGSSKSLTRQGRVQVSASIRMRVSFSLIARQFRLGAHQPQTVRRHAGQTHGQCFG
jgi:hypothetical protein